MIRPGPGQGGDTPVGQSSTRLIIMCWRSDGALTVYTPIVERRSDRKQYFPDIQLGRPTDQYFARSTSSATSRQHSTSLTPRQITHCRSPQQRDWKLGGLIIIRLHRVRSGTIPQPSVQPFNNMAMPGSFSITRVKFNLTFLSMPLARRPVQRQFSPR